MAGPSTRKCTTCGKNRQLQFYATERARICDDCKKKTRRKAGRATHLKGRYKISPEDYKKLLDAGNGVCWICKGSRPYNLAVDHSHVHELLLGTRASIRGLLCKRCNKLLRDVRDDAELLKSAKEFLLTARYRAQELLNE
jgi:hypothetical protein